VHLGLVGAFPFPAPRGSQRYALEQARALRAAGAEVTLVCFGSGDGREVADLRVVRSPRALSPGALRSSLSPARPLADLALAATLVRAQRARPFDALLAHNAEAALAAFAARRWTRVPVVYVAHTLWRYELACYLPAALGGRRGAAARFDAGERFGTAERLGAALDAHCARAADGVLALSEAAAHALAGVARTLGGSAARGPVERIAPGLAPAPPPSAAEIAAACRRHRLAEGGYAVYAGNLDAYQDLDLLAAAAARVPEACCVAVTHDAGTAAPAPLRTARVASPAEARALVHGARLALLPRRTPGGFPIKLLGYLEAGLPVIAFAALADTLVNEESALLLPGDAEAGDLAATLARLWGDEPLRARLAAGARAALASRHAWPLLAWRTLALVAAAVRQRAAARAG
jgi:glycosyltransferase involved in cell wall biosynthesis